MRPALHVTFLALLAVALGEACATRKPANVKLGLQGAPIAIEATSTTETLIRQAAPIKLPTYRCPKCGGEFGGTATMTPTYYSVEVDGRRTKHCPNCYLRWIRANVPELVEVPKELGPPEKK